MIDTVIRLLPQARMPDLEGISTDGYILVTLHHPSNVDDPGMLLQLLRALGEISKQCQVVFPVHSRTRQRIERFQSFQSQQKNILLTEPLGYLEFLALQHNSKMVITDSGGIQEEGPSLGKPVVVMRDVTERPEAVEAGTVKLVGTDRDAIVGECARLLDDEAAYRTMSRAHNPYGDGTAAERIVKELSRDL